jgi:spore maturation protein CgeB
MARFGFSPATRVFEAAGAGACVITDFWDGIEDFFEPGREILVAQNGEEVARILDEISPEKARAIGRRAISRALGEHTYEHRADQFEKLFQETCVA